MPEDSVVPASLAYRKNRDDIWNGLAPQKYQRILPYVRGRRVLEIGAAEGVLSLLLAEAGHDVIACERREERHKEALELQKRWRTIGRKVDACKMVLADITKRPDLFDSIDCLVGVRVMYHLRDQAQAVIGMASAARVDRIVLCGNKNRAARHQMGISDDSLGAYNYFSSIAGMTELLTRADYRIETTVSDGDPIVCGRRN